MELQNVNEALSEAVESLSEATNWKETTSFGSADYWGDKANAKEIMSDCLSRLKPAKFFKVGDVVVDLSNHEIRAEGTMGKGKKKEGVFSIKIKSNDWRYFIVAKWTESGRTKHYEKKTKQGAAVSTIAKGVGSFFSDWRWTD